MMLLQIVALSLSLNASALPEGLRTSPQIDFRATGPCLGEESAEMQGLLPALRGIWAWEGTRRAALRRSARVEHVARLEDIQPVAVDSLCNRALGIIRKVLGEDAKKNSVALVRIGDRYVANYSYIGTYYESKPVMDSIRIYFDDKFESAEVLMGGMR